MKFILLVEGHTERDAAADFLKRWLDERLSRNVKIQVVYFRGYGNFWRKAPRTAAKYLQGREAASIIAVIGLIDLYGPKFYPDNVSTCQSRLQWATGEMERQVRYEKFRMFFAVHEFEAWILAQPSSLPFDIPRNLSHRMEQPETINFLEPPSYLLNRLFRQAKRVDYKKTSDGIKLFKKVDPRVAYERCPNLKRMLDTMLDLAKQAGL